MTTLTATFANNTAQRLLILYRQECEIFGRDFDLTLSGQIIGSSTINKVNGPAQQVMFFIGYVADQGEDTLVSVETDS